MDGFFHGQLAAQVKPSVSFKKFCLTQLAKWPR